MLLYTYISRFSVNPHYQQREKIRQSYSHKFYPQPFLIAFFNFSHKWPTFVFTGESGYTLAFANRIAHNGTHAETGAFRTGPLSLPSERSARSQTSPGRVSERHTLPLLGLGRGCSQRTQRASGQRCAYARRCSEASRPRWAALPAASIYSACFSGIERLDQAFRQSYYHTQRPRGQPFDACAEAALAGKMGAITLDFKESYHGRTLPHKRTDPRVFHGAFSGGAVSGNGGKISAECTRFFPLSGRSARRKKCHFGLERFFAAARVRALHRQRFFGSPELPVQLSRLVGLLHTLPENPAPPVSGDRAGAGSSRP